MSRTLTGNAALAAVPRTRSSWNDAVYRAVWRWHFYAGLLCLPFLILLSVTGSLYLFKDEINGSLFAYRNTVAVQDAAPLSPDRLIFNASEALPDAKPVSFTDPRAPDASALVTMLQGGRKVLVYLNPYNGDVLDRVAADDEFMMVVRRLHSLAYFGPVANGVIEVVAGTGIFFLAATGLPWSVWWGQQFRAWSNEAGLGQPRALWAGKPVSNVPMQEMLTTTGWSMQDAPVPASVPVSAAGIGTDRAAALLHDLGMPRGYELSLPVGATGVFAAAAYPKDVTRQRLISLDQYSGKPLVDVRFGDLGGVARAVQYGIGLHKGEHFGLANQLAMLAFCLATILLSATAAVMWGKRRPAGRLGVPPWPRDRRVIATVTMIVVVLGALFPLTGLAVLGMGLLDAGAQTLRARMAA